MREINLVQRRRRVAPQIAVIQHFIYWRLLPVVTICAFCALSVTFVQWYLSGKIAQESENYKTLESQFTLLLEKEKQLRILKLRTNEIGKILSDPFPLDVSVSKILRELETPGASFQKLTVTENRKVTLHILAANSTIISSFASNLDRLRKQELITDVEVSSLSFRKDTSDYDAEVTFTMTNLFVQ